MKGKLKVFASFAFIFLALFLVNIIFADNSVNLVSPSAQVVATGVNYVYINISSNETIAANGSTIYSWWNETGANVNFTGNSTGTIVANATGPGAPADFSNYTSRNFTNMNDGTHRFMVYLYSNNTNTTNSTSINVTVSTLAAHKLTLNNPAINNLTNLSVNYVFINVSSNETINANTSTFISWWNQSDANTNFTDVTVVNITSSASGNVTRNFTSLADGTHRFMIYVYSNNTLKTNSTSINITVDTTTPVMTVVSYNSSSNPLTTEDNTPQINVTAADGQLNVTGWNISIQIFVDKVMVTKSSVINGTKSLYNLSLLPAGNHTVQVEGNDSVGNRANSTAVVLNVDNQTNSPNMTIHSATQNSLVFAGNVSKTYTLSVLFNMTNGTGILTNVTFFMPYGFVPAVGGVPNVAACNAGGSLRSTGKYNVTHVSCSVFLGNASGDNILANLTVTANYSAMTQYGPAYTFESKLTCGNLLGCATMNASWTLQGAPYSLNPRPDAVITAGDNMTLLFTNWNQTDIGLRVQTPVYTFNPTLGRPVLANNSYGEVIYFDKSVFEMPTFMRLWSYNLTFRVIGANATNITIRNPVNTTLSDMTTQTLVPLLVMTNQITDFHTNQSVNMTMAMPGPNGFTVYWNGTNYSSSAFAAATGITLTFTGGQGNPPDQSVSLLSLVIANDTIAERINNTDLSILFTTANITACGTTSCSTSPLFINSQQISGWSADSPPAFGQTLNTSYLINATNRFVNYTLSNLSIAIMQPMNVTINNSGTIAQFNMTRNINISVWNGSMFIENLGVVRRESNMTFVDQMGPANGATISLYITIFDVQLDSNAAFNATKAWAPNSNATVVINYTAEMQFPVMSETAVPSGAANGSYVYNATIQVPQRAPLNLTAKVPGINNVTCGATGSTCSIVVTVDGSAVAVSNYTVGSLSLKDVTSGQHTVSVSYSIPATAGTGTTGGTPAGGGTLQEQDESSTTFGAITAGEINTMKISKDTIKLKKIEFTSAVAATSVKLTVKVGPKPSDIPDLSTVYQWINVTHTVLTDNDITSATLYFNISKSWIANNSLQQNEVYLQRYTGTWNVLDTTRLSESASEVQYRAVSPGLSTFAITGVKAQAPPPEQEGAVCGNSVREGTEQCDSADLGGATCITQGFDSGTLLCSNNCRFDTVDCSTTTPPLPPREEVQYDYTSIATIIVVLVIIAILGAWYYRSIEKKKTK